MAHSDLGKTSRDGLDLEGALHHRESMNYV